MKITNLKSSTTITESQGIKILTDPWSVDGEYYGTWRHIPPFKGKAMNMFGRDQIISVIDDKGTGFIGADYGIHNGTPPKEKERVLKVYSEEIRKLPHSRSIKNSRRVENGC